MRPSGADKQKECEDEQGGCCGERIAHQLHSEIDHFGFGAAWGRDTCHANPPQVCFVIYKVSKTTVFRKGVRCNIVDY
jgi:hypothetical protein